MRKALGLCLVVGLADVAMAQTSPPPATAVIRGRVIAVDTGRPLRRARVTATSPSLKGQRKEVSTGLDGTYELRELPEGRYSISVARGGYLTMSYGQRRPFEQASPLQVAARQTLDRVDFALPRGGVIGGRITDEAGDPIAGVSVYAMSPRFWQGRRQVVPFSSARTDDAGEYRLRGLSPGAYYIRASTRETWTVTRDGRKQVMLFAQTYLPGTTAIEQARRVSVGVGQLQVVGGFPLIPAAAVNVSGRVMDSRGVPGPRVMLVWEMFGPGAGEVGAAGRAEMMPDGTFTIRDVAPGEYKLQASGSGESAVLPIAVRDVDITNATLVTSPGWSLSGRIATDDGLAPPLAREAVRPLAVAVARSGMGMSNGPRTQVTVNDDWSFSIKAIPGPARLRVTLPPDWALKSIMKDGRDLGETLLEARGGDEVADVQIVVTNRITTVAGSIVDTKGIPTGDGTVLVFAADAQKWADDSRFVRATRPDQQGQWETKALPAGDYLAVAIDYVQDGMWNDPEFLESVRRSATRIRLADGGSENVVLKLTMADTLR